jgi:catechol 2,3-dioxygenase
MAARTDIGVAPPAFRLPESTHIGKVRLQVSDIERSIAYYDRVLGLRPLDRRDGSVSLASKEDEHILLELVEKRGVRPVPHRGLLGLYHFAVLLPDRPALGRFLAHLGQIGERAGMSDHIVSEAIYLTDPDGLGIEVYADRPRDTWKAEERQIVMASKPLDAADVVAAAHGEKWTGVPAGTVIGHVHFYVGDIGEAESFYHAGLGLDKIVWNYPGALFMSAGGYHHHVGTNTWAAGASVATDDDARLIDWELLLGGKERVEDAAASIEKAGYSVERNSGSAMATDPWGIRVRLTPA